MWGILLINLFFFLLFSSSFFVFFFSPETKNPLMIQMTDFLHSFARKLYSIFISLVDFDWCGLGFLKQGHPLVPRQVVRSRIAPHFSSLFLHFKKWWLCKNVIFDKDIWIPASKQMPSLRSHHVGTTYVELGELFLFQFGNDTRRTVYKTYSHSKPVPQMVLLCAQVLAMRKVGLQDQWCLPSHQFPCLYLSSTL